MRAAQLKEELKYKEALELLNSIENADELPPDDQNQYYLLQSKLFYLLGQYNKVLDVLEIFIPICEQSNSELNCVDAFLIKGQTFLWMGKYEDCLNSLLKCEDIINNIQNQPKTLIGKKQQKIVFMWANYYWEQGDFDKMLAKSKFNLDLCKKFGTKDDLAGAYLYLGLSYGEVGEPDKAIENFQKCLELSLEIKDKQSGFDTSVAYNNIGEIYRFKGELDKALEYYNKSFMLCEEIGAKATMSIALHNIALVYCEKRMLKLSLSNFKKVLMLEREIGNNFEISRTLFDIIVNRLEQNEIETSESYLEEIRIINQKEENIRIKYRYRIANALILKKTGINRNIIKAELILNELLEEKSV